MLCASLGGCLRFGPDQLGGDQLGYSRALSQSEKRQTLLNIVRLRYADAPVFLDTTQVISSYQLQRSLSGSFELFPNATGSTFLGGGGSAQLQESPTFTFQPLTGEHFAQSVLRPLSPADLLPLAQGGLPVDVLFRLAVQSVGSLQNATGLMRGGGEGSPGFFTLLHNLRRLQVAGLFGIRIVQTRTTGPEGKPATGPDRVFLTFASPPDASLTVTMADTRRLLRLHPRAVEAEVIYGRVADRPGQIPLLSRSMLGVLGQIAFQIDAPAEDVASGRTLATVGQTSTEERPVMTVRSGSQEPPDAFAATEYEGSWFWLDNTDFDSKLAFTMVSILLALAKNSSPPGAVISKRCAADLLAFFGRCCSATRRRSRRIAWSLAVVRAQFRRAAPSRSGRRSTVVEAIDPRPTSTGPGRRSPAPARPMAAACASRALGSVPT